MAKELGKKYQICVHIEKIGGRQKETAKPLAAYDNSE
jgi:hypothetical protein